MRTSLPALLGCALVVGGCSHAPKRYRGGLFDRFVAASGRTVELHDERDSIPRLGSRELASVQAELRHWSWPLRSVKVTSAFGSRDPNFHEGVDLEASVGTPVYAVRAGTVVYADDEMSGYGRMVIIKHSRNMFSLYAHQSKMLVRVGQHVVQDQRIALSGKTGRVTGPHLHFEIRKGVVPLNPSLVLPEFDS